MSQENSKYLEWCKCDYPIAKMGSFFVYCKTCVKPIECEFCDNKRKATFEHLSYVACKRHEGAAIDCAY
jgi:hypothetical protein